MIWLGVAVRGVGKVNHAIVEGHRAAKVFAAGIKGNDTIDRIRRASRKGRVDQYRAAKFRRARFQVQRIEVLLIGRVSLCLDFGNDIQRAAGYIDHWSSRDAQFDLNIARTDIALWNGYRARGAAVTHAKAERCSAP